ncbi:hypothetical protein [Myroides odoratus]|uniref:Lipoprotein n=1 Tax=Myroides odoratus TaxID=256 RepID=A0A9Q7EA26_MYROD|nr:hypothetical protein [Myroides odoratus]EHQ40947.1 hypothetical protein Myrod_0101 [Myroides odoratus DSM 2801]EKB08212.1 hypothetical protein HMPREF9716_01242 [Myroides odoratus CIP 103059]QQU01892.1 hypothetical protein I6I88_09170 [Myroides odoratus]WQD55819.1 hypothetical protein U0010_09805 [Myroides odoratus]STZ31979.1 Uncharacterised protein [Myroides odoratus]
MKNTILIGGVLISFLFIIFGCQNKKIIEFDGYALLNYYRFEDRKQIEVIPLYNYDVTTSLESYLLKKDTLSRLITYVSSNNLSYDKILDTKYQKENNSGVLYSLVKIKYSLLNIALEWSSEDVDIVQIGKIKKTCKDFIFTDWNNKNFLVIDSMEYLPLLSEKSTIK